MKSSTKSSTKFEVLTAIVDHWSRSRVGPSLEEIGKTVGLSYRSTVHFHVSQLIAEGMLTHIPNKHRTVRPTEKGKRLVEMMREIQDMPDEA